MICRSIRMKLRSARGASITFALLLFLVCAVVGSVVLAAGTAASGRLSRLNEQDRRYYAVTSAAGLFRDALDGQRYTIRCSEVVGQTSTTVYTYPVSGEPTVSDPVTVTDGAAEYSAEVACGSQNWLISTAGKSLLADAAVQWLMGDAERTVVNAWNAGGGYGGSWTLTLEQDVSEGETRRVAKIRVEAVMDANANLLLTFTNAEGDPFSVTVRLSADVKRNEDEPAVSPNGKASVTETDDEGTTTVETTEKSIVTTERTTTITWTVGEVKKVRA
ncbi:MAG: hypothetical protein IJR65_06075 [Oscillospiraceae bacterium]|nr:hypothetical protein [Oscillospiraceae bacterium]